MENSSICRNSSTEYSKVSQQQVSLGNVEPKHLSKSNNSIKNDVLGHNYKLNVCQLHVCMCIVCKQVHVSVLCVFTHCSWPMQTLAANRGNEGSSGLILAHSLNTDTAPTPCNTVTHTHTHTHTHITDKSWFMCTQQPLIMAATDDMDRFQASVSNTHQLS